MPITTLKVLASVLQLHGPGATIQSDHQGIDAVLNDRASSGVHRVGRTPHPLVGVSRTLAASLSGPPSVLGCLP